MRRTYIDPSVLIAAFRGTEEIANQAFQVLADPERRLVVSDFVRLEVLPKPTYLGREEEVEFMSSILAQAAENIPCSTEVVEQAIELASRYDIAPMDALHMGASITASVDEFVTLEKPSKPLFRVKEIRVISLYPDEGKP